MKAPSPIVLPRDFKQLLSGDRRTAAIVVDTRFSKSQRDVETFLEFVNGRLNALTPEDREELLVQAEKDAEQMRKNPNFGMHSEGWSNR